MGVGDYVGEMALIQNAPRAASVRTLTDVRVLEIDKADFESMLNRSPRLAISIIRTTLNRMRANDQVAIQDLQRTNHCWPNWTATSWSSSRWRRTSCARR